jgi:hypothetical protein
MKILLFTACVFWLFAASARSQGTIPAPADPNSSNTTNLAPRPVESPVPAQTVALAVPKGTPLQVALDKEVRVHKTGQNIHGRIIAPVYAFDRIVIPVGTEVLGEITKIDQPTGAKRTEAALNADFTPARKIETEFTEIILPEGKHIAVHTTVTPGSGEVLQFAPAGESKDQNKGVADAAEQRTKAAKEEAKREWDSAKEQVEEPNKARRLGHFALAQLPVHPQYIQAGTVYFAELQEPLDFGSELLTPQMASSLLGPPPEGSVVQAQLLTPLSSAISQKGDEVEALVSRPLFDGERLMVPQGSLLKGSVLQVHPARHPGRNGELRLVFHQLVLPDGVQEKVEAAVAGLEAAKADNVRLDSEGGAHATSSPVRFLNAGLAVGLGAFSMIGDSGGGDIGHETAGGAGGYKLIGIALGAAIRSQPLGMAMGAFGATRSIYVNFVARGHEVVFPKNTAMQIAVGTRAAIPTALGTESQTDAGAKP